MDNTLLHNAVGTAYNVLLEQKHPDSDKLGALLREMMETHPAEGSFFDLRYRHFDGKTLNG